MATNDFQVTVSNDATPGTGAIKADWYTDTLINESWFFIDLDTPVACTFHRSTRCLASAFWKSQELSSLAACIFHTFRPPQLGLFVRLGVSGIDDVEAGFWRLWSMVLPAVAFCSQDSEKVPRLVNMNPDKSLEADGRYEIPTTWLTTLLQDFVVSDHTYYFWYICKEYQRMICWFVYLLLSCLFASGVSLVVYRFVCSALLLASLSILLVEISDVMLQQLALIFSNDGTKAQRPWCSRAKMLVIQVRCLYTSCTTGMIYVSRHPWLVVENDTCWSMNMVNQLMFRLFHARADVID